jgi:hypothetical protein
MKDNKKIHVKKQRIYCLFSESRHIVGVDNQAYLSESHTPLREVRSRGMVPVYLGMVHQAYITI